LSPGTTYYWKVQGFNNTPNPDQPGEYSVTGSFTTATSPLPDLVIEGLSANPPSGGPGSSVTVSFLIRNQGGAAAASSISGIRLNSSSAPIQKTGSSDLGLDAFSVAAIAAGESRSFSRQVGIPNNAAPGTHYIWVVADVFSMAGQAHASEEDDTAHTPFLVQSASASLSGRVLSAAGGVGVASVQLSGAAVRAVQAPLGGTYLFEGLLAGSYTITPSLAGYRFSPSLYSPALGTTSKSGFDFRACNEAAPLTGRVSDASTGAPLVGAVVSVDGVGAASATSASGDYQRSGVGCGLVTVRVVGASGTGYGSLAQSFDTFDSKTLNISLVKSSTVLGPNTLSGYSADPVNTATGNYVYRRKDFGLPGKGMPLVFERFYSSQEGPKDAVLPAPRDLPLGPGWSHSLDVRVEEEGGASAATVRWGDRRTETYTLQGDSSYKAPTGVFNTLEKRLDGTFRLRTKDLVTYVFNAARRLESISDRNSNLISLYYFGGRLSQVIDTAGRTIAFGYDANGRMSSIQYPEARQVRFAYDAAGDLVEAIDARGGSTAYTYDVDHQILSVTDPNGHVVVENAYDPARRVVAVQRDAIGTRTTYFYDPDKSETTVTVEAGGRLIKTIHRHDSEHRLIEEVDPLGRSTKFTYDPDSGTRIKVTNKRGFETLYTYDLHGNVTSKTRQPSGDTTVVGYDTLNNPVLRRDPLGFETSFEYDTRGNLVLTKDAESGQTKITVDGSGLPTVLEDANGNRTRNTYDAQGNLITVENALGQFTRYTYDGAGRRRTMADDLARVTLYEYDAADNLIAVTDPSGNTTQNVHDSGGNRTEVHDALGRITHYTYDAKDRLTAVTDPDGYVATTAYDSLDRKVAFTDRRGNTTRFAYDDAGNLVTVTNALGQQTRFTYDENGNRLSRSGSTVGRATYAYDQLDRLVSETTELGSATQYRYDRAGRIIEKIDAKGRSTSLVYDRTGRLKEVHDPKGGVVAISYDAAGNRRSLEGPGAGVLRGRTEFQYDALNRLSKRIDPNLGETEHGYDRVGNLVSVRDPNGAVTLLGYDLSNRLERIEHSGASPIVYTLDRVGNRRSMQDAFGTTLCEYDSLDRLKKVVDAFGQTVEHRYDQEGNRIRLIYPSRNEVAYEYDELNRLKGARDWLGGVTTYSYDGAGRLISTSLPNGSSMQMQYDGDDRVNALASVDAGSTLIAAHGFGYDEVGNVEWEGEYLAQQRGMSGGAWDEYSYDKEDRIVARSTADGGVTNYAHDRNGNRIIDAEPGRIVGNTFDARDLLVRRSDGAHSFEYGYDGDGRRVRRVEDGAEARYALDTTVPLFRVLEERDSSNRLTASYIYGLGLISRIDATNQRSVYHFDRQGSTLALTDNRGVITDTYSYGPFGEPLTRTGETPNPFTFLGRHGVMEEGEGLYFARARFYDSANGRFINKDPKAGKPQTPQSLNRYTYSHNNPIVLSDTSGLAPEGAAAQGYLQPTDSDNAGLFDSELLPMIKFLGIAVAKKVPVVAARHRPPGTPLTSYTSASRAANWLANDSPTSASSLVALGAETLNASLRLNEAASAHPNASNVEALGWVSGELTVMIGNVVTSPGRALGNYLLTRASGGDQEFESELRSTRIVGSITLDSVLQPLSGKQVFDAVQKSANWVGEKLDSWGFY
jgi:RHS repeat-associated protein